MACLGLLALFAYLFESTRLGDYMPAFRAVPLDDAWIHFVYARNTLTSGLLHYQPGQPAAGTTSLLWVLLLSVPLRLGCAAPSRRPRTRATPFAR